MTKTVLAFYKFVNLQNPKEEKEKLTSTGSRTQNLLIRSQAPYPLGQRDDRTERTSEVAQSFLGI